MQVMDAGDLEIERRLDSYARARLTPDQRAAARIRARVMREARLQFDAARIAAHVMPAVARANRRSLTRRLAMPSLAAAVWLGIAAGSISAAQAGGPLYPARIWIENATLPSTGAARTGVELEHLDARLAEAMAAAAHGDAGAVAAALDAYHDIADGAMISSSGNATLEARVAAALEQHRMVLTAVAQRLDDLGNTSALAAVETSIQRAIAHNEDVIARLKSAGASGQGGGLGGPGSAGGGASTPGGAGSGGGSGASSRPERSPRPAPAKPDKSEKPDATTRGGPDH